MSYMIRLRRAGEQRHRLLARGGWLTNLRAHALSFPEQPHAEQTAQSMLDHNDCLDSAQVIDADSLRVLARLGASATDAIPRAPTSKRTAAHSG